MGEATIALLMDQKFPLFKSAKIRSFNHLLFLTLQGFCLKKEYSWFLMNFRE